MIHKEKVGYKIRLLHNQIHKIMEGKRLQNEGDLTGMQRWVIGYLSSHEKEDIYQKDIEAAFSISRATASNMLSTMERYELIQRVTVEHDARLRKIVLTDKAVEMLRKASDDVQEMEARLLHGMTEEEIAQLNRLLGRMMENLEIEDCCPGIRRR